MSSVRGHNWYNLNSTRRYPLDDAVTGETDDGRDTPDDILVDCHIRFPRTVGEYIYISSMVTSERLISLTFLASDTPALAPGGCLPSLSSSSSSGSASSISSSSMSSMGPPILACDSKAVFTPVAAITLLRDEINIYRQHAVESLYPGVGGWVVFGSGVEQPRFNGRYAGPAQTMLSPRVARPYDPLPIPSMAKQFATPLTGLVLIQGGTDVRVFKAAREIWGVTRDVLVITLDTDDLTRNVLEQYKGPCGGRPESGTCNKPGVDHINSVIPDCNGNIDIIFVSVCAEVGQHATGSGGFVLDYCLGLQDACNRDDRLPKDGKLPNEYEDQCNPDAEIGSASQSSVSLGSVSSEGPTPLPSSSSCSTSLPYIENYGDAIAQNFYVKFGSFSIGANTYQAANLSRRNVAVWDDCSYGYVRDKTVEVRLKLTTDGNPNGGMVIDWREVGPPAHEEYFVVELFKATDSFRLRFFTGATFITLADAKPVGLKFNTEYRIIATLQGANPTTAIFQLFEGDTLRATINYQTSNLSDDAGLFGVCSNQATPIFTYFRLAEYP